MVLLIFNSYKYMISRWKDRPFIT